MEFNPEIFNSASGLLHWATVGSSVTAIFLLVGLVVSCLRHGFFAGFDRFGRSLKTVWEDTGALIVCVAIVLGYLFAWRYTTLGDRWPTQYWQWGLIGLVAFLFLVLWLGTGLVKRTMAIAKLTFKEAIRRKALMVFVVFCILFMFAGWFLAGSADRPQLRVKSYISFVLTAITWLLLMVMLLLSCWGIPEDIRLRSLHTVVTKPTKRIEIVLGRIFGFTAIGLLVLTVMGVTGYIWIQRQLDDGQKELLTCRVPVYGPLEFLSDTGQPEEVGINVGDMWKHRSYISGTSQARAIWEFDGITKERLQRDEPVFADRAGALSSWLVEPGAAVEQGDVIAEVSGSGGTKQQVLAAASGVFKESLVSSGGDVDPDIAIAMISAEFLELESNFEAFRTHKGNMKTGGLIAQYMLVRNDRAKAFADIASSNNFQRAANELRRGQYQNAADSLRLLGNKLEANQIEFARGELRELADAFQKAGNVIGSLSGQETEGWVFDVSDAFRVVGTEASDAASFGEAAGDYTLLGGEIIKLSEQVETHQAELREHLARLSVPLPSFVVREYRFGENVLQVDPEITFSANNEDIARFLSAHLTNLSEAGKLVENGELVEDLAEQLYENNLLTIENADQAATVVQQLVQSGDLTIEDSKLVPAEGASMFSVVSAAVTDGRLSADDGWELTANLFEDLVTDEGKLRVEVACLSAGQYLGMAKPDLFVRLPDREFASGYFKAIASIGMMMMLIVTFGVCASCFVKGPVAIFLTLSVLVIGQPFAYDFMTDLVNERVEGGGFVEALIRMAKQQNPQVPLGINETVEAVVKAVDRGIFWGLNLVKNIIPQFDSFTQGTRFVENGFDVPFGSCIARCIATLFGFLLPCVLVGFISLRFRELEAK